MQILGPRPDPPPCVSEDLVPRIEISIAIFRMRMAIREVSFSGWDSPPPIEPGFVRVRLERMERKIRNDVPFRCGRGPWRKSDFLCGERDPVLAMERSEGETKGGCVGVAKRMARPVEVPTGAGVVDPLCFSLSREVDREPVGPCHRTDRSTNHRSRRRILPYPLGWEIHPPPRRNEKGGRSDRRRSRGNGVPSRRRGV